MAIQNNDTGATNQAGAAQPEMVAPANPNQAQPTPGAGAAQPSATADGRSNINTRFRRSATVVGNDVRSSEALTAFTEAGKLAVEQQLVGKDFQVYRFERNTHEVGMSAIVITKTHVPERGVPMVAIRTIMLQNDADRLPMVETPIIGQNGMTQETLQRKPTAKDILTKEYWSRLSGYVRSQQAMSNAVTHTAGTLVIPSSFNFKDNADRVLNVLLSAINTCEDTLQRLLGEQPFSVATDIKKENETLVVKMDFEGKPVFDSVGNPIRADILITLNRSTKSKAERKNEYFEADDQLNQVAVAVGLEYMPVQQQVWGAPLNQPQIPGANAPFTPTLTITDVRPAPWIQAHTLEMHLFALLNPYLATSQQMWAKAFVPDLGRKVDPRDIGALGYFIEPARAKIETKGETFTPAHFAELMQMMVKPNPIILMDLNRIGDNSALDLFFLDAMSNGDNRAKANAAIHRAGVNLFGQAYLKYINPETDWIVQPYGTEITVGSYVDERGEKRPATDLDLMMAANLSEGNQQEIQAFYATMADETQVAEVRMRNRENMELRYLGNTIERVSRMDRAIVNPKWIEGMAKAATDVGLNVAMENVTAVFGGRQFRGNATIGQFALTGAANLGMGGGATVGYNTTGSVGMLYQ